MHMHTIHKAARMTGERSELELLYMGVGALKPESEVGYSSRDGGHPRTPQSQSSFAKFFSVVLQNFP